MSDERAMSEDEIETMAWQLESKMAEIRADPRAALTDGLAKIRSMMLAEYKAHFEKMLEAKMAKLDALMAEELAKRQAWIEAEFADLMSDLRAARADLSRQVHADETAQRLLISLKNRVPPKPRGHDDRKEH